MLQSEIDISSCDLCPRVAGLRPGGGSLMLQGRWAPSHRPRRAALLGGAADQWHAWLGHGVLLVVPASLRILPERRHCRRRGGGRDIDRASGADLLRASSEGCAEYQPCDPDPLRAVCARRARFGARAGDGPSRRLEHLGIRNGSRRPRKSRLCGCVSHRLQICLFRSGCPIFKGS